MNLLRASRVFVFEPPPGVKANLLRTFSAVPATRMCKVSFVCQNLAEGKYLFELELHQGSHGSWKTWKFKNLIFQAWKVMEFNCQSWKVVVF